MREIKFRAWDGSEMCQWELCENTDVPNDISYFFYARKNNFTYPWEHPDLIKLQWTGLKDKNGKDIYEGDVVTHETLGTEGGRYKVKYKNGLHNIDVKNISVVKVIGNIYQNPELINEN